MKSKVLKHDNIDHLQKAIDQFISSSVVKSVVAMSSHEAFGEHVVIILYQAKP